MIKVNDILEFLKNKYPFESACDFDNVGLLVGDKNDTVKKVLVCLDADMSAVNEAVKSGANLIVTHHPVIFDALKTVTGESVVMNLIRNNISVISVHTNFDVAENGVNDILCSLLPIFNVRKFKADDGYLLNYAETDIENANLLAEKLRLILGFSVRYVEGRPIKKLLICSGSGGNFIGDVIKNGFDALITADVKYNQFVEAKNNNISLFDAGHYATENVCIKPLCKILSDNFAKTQFITYEPNFVKSN
ncbi:MAG: Nif3-like dinuclear metal center hexameric protein [Clostridia bacterium]|nr:Nif3-like dinuclear metal center hexameric protein [Clostridia bacterium]